MDRGITVKIETTGSRHSIADALYSWWFDLKNGLEAQCRGDAGQWLKRTYISEIRMDEHEELKDGFVIFFRNPGGMCHASSGITHHMATLLLAHNAAKFAKRLNLKNYTLMSDFGTVEEIRSQQDLLYADYNGLIVGIRLPVNDTDRVEDCLIADSGQEIAWTDLPAKKQKEIREMIEHKNCQCFVCKKISKGTLKYMTFY